ncbi:MAG TPA: FAD-dependent thymidylate synthase, partial [Candidatus Limnocylindria bacterium]
MDTLERPATVTQSQRTEIEAQRQATSETRRATVPAMEALLYQPIPVLDHGFIRVIDYMGDDAAVVQAARVSYGAGTKKIREDAGLINYLMRHRHTSPFEMCELKLHAKMPIFVAREWVRHRVANLNETSGRYSILDNEFYLPAPEQLGTQSRSNRQGRGETITGPESIRVLEILREDAERSYSHYEEMLNENIAGDTIDPARSGLARELARMNLSVNFYTQWYWKIDLHNLLHFLNLRTDAHAQYEIRVYADAILEVVKQWVPLTYAAFMDYRKGAYELSAKGLAAVRR